MDAILGRLTLLPPGYSEALYQDRRYGVTRSTSEDRRRWWLFAEELGGTDRVSCNLYRLESGGILLRPCEMPAEKVAQFILCFIRHRGEEPGDPVSTQCNRGGFGCTARVPFVEDTA